MNKLIYTAYTILFAMITIVIVSFLMNWIEILETLNKMFYLFGASIFLTTVILSKSLIKMFKIPLNLFSFFAFSLWILSLLNVIEFYEFSNFSFLSLLILMILSIYLNLIKLKNLYYKIFTTISFIFLVFTILLSGQGYYSSNLVVIIALSIFSALVFYFLLFKTKIQKIKVSE